MEKQTMSVTQALAELKLLDKRLQKSLGRVQWMAVSTKTRPVNEKRLEETAKSEYQSYMDLVKRRQSIKQAIVQSNALTKVKIGTWEGTVAEAIEYKTAISYKQKMLEVMKKQVLDTRSHYDAEETNVSTRLDRLLASELGKDVKTNPDTIQAITVSFRENNKISVVDPLGLEEKVNQLEEEIESFTSNVDWALSEANGKTTIAV
jgi:hypothetical protein